VTWDGGITLEAHVRNRLRDFICANYLFGDATRAPSDHESLIGTGIIDSTGVLELIEFLENHFCIDVLETETVPQNLDSISNLTRFVVTKLESSPTGVRSHG
jgi:acyl carrier protein